MQIEKIGIDQSELVFDQVLKLLVELGEEGDELGNLNKDKVLRAWREIENRYSVFIARNERSEVIGILTLMECFAIYANGNYGVIDEMYVHPEFRSAGVGTRLVGAAADYGKQRGWSRIDVTAPESERWHRTKAFYEKLGFVFTGPKLKKLLD